MIEDRFNLQRFIDAQEAVYMRVRAELQAGKKSSHWMWFIFPHLAALGRSATAKHFGIASLDEAVAFVQHPLLGARLKECAALMIAVQGKTALQILGPPDDLKLRSSMTLFAHAAPEETVFDLVLAKYFAASPDDVTLALLRNTTDRA